jgi:ABC-type polysaccharide/polyol phosphate transport system ATPase subunit
MTSLVRLEAVSMRFATESNPEYAVFGDINLSISAGERVAVIGRNGSGKSTLLRVMARIFAPSGGVVNRSLPFARSVHFLMSPCALTPRACGRGWDLDQR